MMAQRDPEMDAKGGMAAARLELPEPEGSAMPNSPFHH